jgi:predicted protein tyrosine phosphatase
MFEIKVCELDLADFHHTDWGATRMVSLLDEKMRGKVADRADRLVLHFSDVNMPNASRTPPMKIHVERVLEFTKDLTDADKLIVHCHAGVSRSTAMMIAILCQHGVEPKQAIQQVQAVRPQLWPNTLVTLYADEVLGLGGELIREVGEWLEREKGTLMFMPGHVTEQQDVDANINVMQNIMDRLKGLE